MPNCEPKERCSIKLKGPGAGTASWARVLADGRLELELYDHSEAAQDNFGNDVAWPYRVAVSELPRLIDLLQKRTGMETGDDLLLLEALNKGFVNVDYIVAG